MADTTTIVSHLEVGEHVVDETPIGFVILNYLIKTKVSPTANVVYSVGDNDWRSLYSYDLLSDTLADIPEEHVIITTDTFSNERDAYASITALNGFLVQLVNPSHHELELLNITSAIINPQPVYRPPPPPAKLKGDPVKTREFDVPPQSRAGGLRRATPVITDVRTQQPFVPSYYR